MAEEVKEGVGSSDAVRGSDDDSEGGTDVVGRRLLVGVGGGVLDVLRVPCDAVNVAETERDRLTLFDFVKVNVVQ